MAGCWCIQRSRVPSPDEALALINSYDWTEHTEDHDQDDAQRALDGIMSAKIRMPGQIGDRTIFELVRDAHSVHGTGGVEKAEAAGSLERNGIKLVERDAVLLFGTGTTNLKRLVANTPFVTDVRGQLLRLPGANRYNDRAQRFNGTPSKCVAIPLSLLFDDAKQAPTWQPNFALDDEPPL